MSNNFYNNIRIEKKVITDARITDLVSILV